MRIGGPHMIRLPDGRLIASGREHVAAKNPATGQVVRATRTSLWQVDLDAGRLTKILELPSGGDTSYPGLVWHDGHLWISYYSGHEGDDSHAKTAIYLAKVAIPR